LNVKTEKVNLSQIRVNPDNPRTIDKTNMDRLIKSLQDFPEMMQLREIIVDENMMILGGNMRYLALKELNEQECIAKIVEGLNDEQKREFIIKDNAPFGQWDLDILANEWDDVPLADWGVDTPKSWRDVSGEPPENEPEPKLEESQIVVCPKCHHEFSILKEKE